MKLSLKLFAAIVLPLVGLVQGYKPDDDDWFLLSNHVGGSPKDCDDYNFCATTKDGRQKTGTYVVLDRCNTWEDVEGWRTWTAQDGNGFLLMLGNGNGYSGDPDAMCMQVGSNTGRSRVRIRPCNIDSPLQRWIWKDYKNNCGKNEGGKIKLQSNKDLCLTSQGANAPTPNVTPLIVMPCNEIQGARAKGWYGR